MGFFFKRREMLQVGLLHEVHDNSYREGDDEDNDGGLHIFVIQ